MKEAEVLGPPMSKEEKAQDRRNATRMAAVEGYIFDETEILQEAAFTQFFTKGHGLCYGLYLPRWDEHPKTGDLVQNWKPVIITSSKESVRVNSTRQHRKLGVRWSMIPDQVPRRYSLKSIPEWLTDQAVPREPGDLYHEIMKVYEQYAYMAPAWYGVHALWDMATYLYTLFPAFPYLELRGVRRTGKTKVMALSRQLSFNPGSIMTNPTPAVLFRQAHTQRGTLYLDECETLFYRNPKSGRIEHDDRVEILNSGYTSEGSVIRMERPGNRFIAVTYYTYCPKMLASIKGLHGATEDRAIVHVMTRAPDNDPRGEIEVGPEDPVFQRLRDDLFLFGLSHAGEVQKAYAAIKDTGLVKRDLQLWRPLLAIADVIGGGLRADVLKVAHQQQEVKKAEEFAPESWEYCLLERTYQLLKGGQQVILWQDLREAIPGDQKPTSKTISSIMNGLGFRDHFTHTRDGNGFRISREEFEILASTLAPNIITFTSSPPSPAPEFEEESLSAVKLGEDNADSVKVRREGSDENEEVKVPRGYPGVGGVRGVSSAVLLSALETTPGPVSYEDLQARFPGVPIDEHLRELRNRGDIYNPKPGKYQVLK